jgi:hypothetical protein
VAQGDVEEDNGDDDQVDTEAIARAVARGNVDEDCEDTERLKQDGGASKEAQRRSKTAHRVLWTAKDEELLITAR